MREQRELILGNSNKQKLFIGFRDNQIILEFQTDNETLEIKFTQGSARKVSRAINKFNKLMKESV